jgi:hypothetical protein
MLSLKGFLVGRGKMQAPSYPSVTLSHSHVIFDTLTQRVSSMFMLANTQQTKFVSTARASEWLSEGWVGACGKWFSLEEWICVSLSFVRRLFLFNITKRFIIRFCLIDRNIQLSRR